MKIKVFPSATGGRIIAPPSKSSMQRAVAAALLARGTTTIVNPSWADDSLSAIKIAECLGASVSSDGSVITINGGFNPVCSIINPGESGLGIRMFSPIAALHDREITVIGTGSLLSRPMDTIASSLNDLGATVVTTEGRLPVKVKGPLKGGTALVDGSISSQFLTGLLFALPLAENDSCIRVNNLASKPYIDLTIKVLNHFGVEVENNNYIEFRIKGGQQYRACRYRVEPDWSGLAFHGVLGAIGGEVIISGIDSNPVQADSVITRILARAGATVDETGSILRVVRESLRGFEADISDCPDLAPPLVALASYCSGVSRITGTQRLAVKESNRAETLREEFGKLGVVISTGPDIMEIKGTGRLRGGEVDAHGDHRIAMALAVAASRADSPVIINGAEAVAKSYPGFFTDVEKLGLRNEKIK